MKKIKYLLSAIPAALFATSAHADISVSGSGTAAYTDAGGNASSTMGGGVSFSMSTTTDAGVTITGSSAISNLGLLARAIAIITLCLWPPES